MTAAAAPRRIPRTPKAARDPQAIAKQTAVLLLERRMPTFARKMKASDVVATDDQIDRSLLHISKDLLDPKLLTEIGAVDRQLRAWLSGQSVACSMLARGMWLIPLGLFEAVDARVQEWSAGIARLARVLAQEKYADAKKDAERRLGKHFNSGEYPEPDALEASFGGRARWITFNLPGALMDMNNEIAARELQRLNAEWATASDEIRTALRESFAQLVENMAERLGADGETGKAKRFGDGTVEKMQDFLATFAARNLTGDDALAQMAEKARALLNGVAPSDLRAKENVRARVLKGMGKIQGQLAALEVLSPRARKFAAEGEV